MLVIVYYILGILRGILIISFFLKVIWKFWEVSREDFFRVYGEYYNIFWENRIVDGYWEDKFNLILVFEVLFFKFIVMVIVENVSFEYDVVLKL